MYFTDEMLYSAFRAAFLHTLDCMLRESLNQRTPSGSTNCGFLDIYPKLLGAASQVQLECLFNTWEKLHRSDSRLSRLDACVVNAAWEELARTANSERRPMLAKVWQGDADLKTQPDHWVTSKVRALQLAMEETDSTEVVRMAESLDERKRRRTDANPSENEDIFGIVGRWTASKSVVLGSKGLLTDDEQDILRVFFEEQPGLLR